MPSSDDLLDMGDDEPTPTPKRGPGRPRGSKTKAKAPTAMVRSDSALVAALRLPVGITFIGDVLRMDRETVKKRLAACPPIEYHKGNVPLYDFRQAIDYLAVPKADKVTIMRAMRAGELPADLQKDVWDARLKEQKWRKEAGELWPTEDVLEVLGNAFQRLKTTTQLWIDQIGDTHALPAAARKELTDRVDALQADLHRALVEMPKEKATLSQAGDHAGVDAVEDDDG